jgi:hypothetical protein
LLAILQLPILLSHALPCDHPFALFHRRTRPARSAYHLIARPFRTHRIFCEEHHTDALTAL